MLKLDLVCYTMQEINLSCSLKTTFLKWRPDYEVAADEYSQAGKRKLQSVYKVYTVQTVSYSFYSSNMFSGSQVIRTVQRLFDESSRLLQTEQIVSFDKKKIYFLYLELGYV